MRILGAKGVQQIMQIPDMARPAILQRKGRAVIFDGKEYAVDLEYRKRILKQRLNDGNILKKRILRKRRAERALKNLFSGIFYD